MLNKNKERAWFRWFVPIVVVLLMLLLAEIGVRVAAKTLYKERGSTYDSELGWRLVESITKKDYQWCDELPATTNSSGWRDEEFYLEKTEGITRILALGDSFTFGFGVDFGQRFSEFLEEKHHQLEVFNMGVFAYGTDQQVRVYELHGRQYKPDIVLLNVYLGNDIEDLRYKMKFSLPKPYLIPDNDKFRFVKPERSWSVFVNTHSYIAHLLFKLLGEGKLNSVIADELRDADMVPLFHFLIERLSNDARADGTRLLLVLHHPREATEEERSSNANLSKELIVRGHEVLDLHSVFIGLAGQDSKLHLADGHLNPAGHRFAADMIMKDLVARGWILP